MNVSGIAGRARLEEDACMREMLLQLRARWIPVSVVLVLLVAAGLAVKPTYRAVKNWRAVQLMEQAMELQRSGDEMGALQRARAAYQLSSQHPEVIMRMARLHEPIHALRADEFWRILSEHPQAEERHHLAFVDYLLRMQFYGRLPDALQTLGNWDPVPPGYLRRLGEYQASVGRIDEAVRTLRQAMAEDENDHHARLLLAKVELASGKADHVTVQRLFETAEAASGETELQALGQLVGLTALGPEQTERVRQLLKRSNDVRAPLLAADLELRLRPTEQEQIFSETAAVAKESAIDQRLEAGRWLNQRQNSERTLDVIDRETAMSRRDAFLIHADALALQNRWPELEQLLSMPTVPLEPVLVHVFRTRIALAQEDESRAALHWGRALQEAVRQPDNLWFMASYAEKLGQLDMAVASYHLLSRNADTARTAYLAWLRLLEREGRTVDLHELLQMMAGRFPNDPVVLNDLAYVSLLLGRNSEQSMRMAHEMTVAQPEIAAFRVTLALARLRVGDSTTAWALFNNFPDKDAWNPGWRAVGVAAAAAAGDAQSAARLREGLNVQALKPEERALMQAAGY